MRLSFIFILFFSIHSIGLSQILNNQLSSDKEWYVSILNSTNGMPQNTINNIVKDKNGMFWMSTQDGIVRFDGHRIKVFSTSKIKGFNRSRVAALVPLNDTLLIIGEGFLDTNYAYISNNRISADVRMNQYIHSNYIISSGGGHIFSKTKYGYIFKNLTNTFSTNALHMSLGKNKLFTNPHLPTSPNTIFVSDGLNSHLYHNKSDSIIGVYDNNGNNIRDIKVAQRLFFYQLPYKKNLLLIYQDGTFKSFYKGENIYSGKINFPKLKINQPVRIICANNDGDLFLYTNNSLYILSLDVQHNLTPILLVRNIDFGGLQNIYFDKKSNTLFIGSTTMGLWILKKRYYKVMSIPSVENNSYDSVLEVTDNKVISSNHSDYVVEVSTASNSIAILNRFKKSNRKVYSLYKDNQGRVWGYVKDYITNHYDVGYFTNKNLLNFHSITPNDSLRALFDFPKFTQSFDGAIWITSKYGLCIFENNVIRLEHRINWQNSKVFTLLCDRNSNLWIGTAIGLYQYNIKHNLSNHIDKFGKDVRALKIEKDSCLWVGTYGNGFYYYQKGKVFKPPLDINEILRNVHAFQEDKKGHLWLTTNRGLFFFKKESFLKKIELSHVLDICYYYETLFGQPSDEFNGGDLSPLIDTKNGTFVGASLAGLVVFNPTYIPTIYPSTPIVIDKITIQQKDTVLKNGATLSYNFEQLSIELAQAYLGHPYNQKIEYRLVGLGDLWYPYSPNQAIIFTQLTAGKYSLQVRFIKDLDGTYEYENLLSFEIESPWYLTKRALVAYLLSLILLFISLLKIRTKRILEKNKELEKIVDSKTEELRINIDKLETSNHALEKANKIKNRLIAIIAHDMKTPILFLNSISKRAVNYDKIKLLNFIESVNITTQQLNQWLTTILHWMKTSDGNLSYNFISVDLKIIIEDVILTYTPACLDKNNKISNNIHSSCYILGDPNWLRILINNIIENSVKFTQNGVIIIESYYDSQYIYIKFKDSGIGIDPENLMLILSHRLANANKGTNGEQGVGLGFAIINNIVSEHHGNITIVSALHKGTSITLQFPKRHT